MGSPGAAPMCWCAPPSQFYHGPMSESLSDTEWAKWFGADTLPGGEAARRKLPPEYRNLSGHPAYQAPVRHQGAASAPRSLQRAVA